MTSMKLPWGPVMLDVEGTRLTAVDRERLLHPLTGGVILFTRNFENPAQLAALTTEIHALRDPKLLIAVDQEGGRVQRFREGFTQLPPMRSIGHLWDRDPMGALQVAEACGLLLAAELRGRGVDLSFTPVLDIDYGNSGVIGDRAFHSQPGAIAELAIALMRGLSRGGMAAVGKHFPGHGHVRGDSHHEVPVDDRSYFEIEAEDLLPFRLMAMAGMQGVMPAHVIYTRVDQAPAGFSSHWLKQVLRSEMGFDGVIFSDDLSMEGASVAGGVVERGIAALDAGCDMVLVCNNHKSADKLLDELGRPMPASSQNRLARLFMPTVRVDEGALAAARQTMTTLDGRPHTA